MNTEFEAKFEIKDKEAFRQVLEASGARLLEPERLMRRALFGAEFGQGRWLRLRDEGHAITLTFKDRSERSVTGTKEVEVIVSDFDDTLKIIDLSAVPKKAYQENKRESWELDGAQIEIDTWPKMKPHVEIEADSEAAVKKTALRLGFKWTEAFHDTADEMYARQNNVPLEQAYKDFEDLRF